MLSKNSSQNLLLLQAQINVEALNKRMVIMNKQKKWQDFKERRLQAIDRFIAVKKRQLRIKRLTLLIFLRSNLIKSISSQFESLKKDYQIHKKGQWLHKKISVFWVKRRQKLGNSLDQVLQKDIQKKLKFLCITSIQILEDRSLRILKPALVQYIERFKIKNAFEKFHSQVLYI